MSKIDDAIDFCASFDAELPAQIAGAAPALIGEIEYFLQRPPGETHRQFLERLGAKAGWLSVESFDTDAQSIVKAHSSTSGTLQAGYDLFGVAPDEPFDDLYLVEQESGEPAVYAIPTLRTGHYKKLPGLPRTLIAGSLPELLCRTALERFRFDGARLQAYYSQVDQAALHTAFDNAMTAAGLSIAWFSDWMTHAALVEGLTVLATQRPDESMYVRIAGEDAERFHQVTEVLREKLDLQPLAATAG